MTLTPIAGPATPGGATWDLAASTVLPRPAPVAWRRPAESTAISTRPG